jgi:hypothetical protein
MPRWAWTAASSMGLVCRDEVGETVLVMPDRCRERGCFQPPGHTLRECIRRGAGAPRGQSWSRPGWNIPPEVAVTLTTKPGLSVRRSRVRIRYARFTPSVPRSSKAYRSIHDIHPAGRRGRHGPGPARVWGEQDDVNNASPGSQSHTGDWPRSQSTCRFAPKDEIRKSTKSRAILCR